MSIALKAFLFVFDLVLPMVAGYLVARWSGLRTESFDRMMTGAIFFVAPPLALLSCWVIEINPALAWLPVLGMGMQIIPGLVGFFRSRFKSHDELERGSYVVSTILSNRGVVGGLTVFILFGETAYGYSRLIIVLGMVTLYGVCFPLARYFHASHHEKERDESLVGILLDKRQVPLIGLAAGFALNAAGLDRPAVLGGVFTVLVHLLAWMLLVPVGASIDLEQMRDYWKDVWDLLPLKFVFTPVVIYLLGRAVGLEGEVLATLVILAASPTAINAVITSKLHDLNVHLSMASFVLTTGTYLLLVFPAILVFEWLWGTG